MRCKKIQGLLKSDFLDGEAGSKEVRAVQEHLARCPQCRAMEKELFRQRSIFSNSRRPAPPERVWENIRQAITAERLIQEERPRESVWERLRNFKSVSPRSIFAFSGIFAVMVAAVFLAGVALNNRVPPGDNGAEAFADYRVSGEVASDFGTNVEKFFL